MSSLGREPGQRETVHQLAPMAMRAPWAPRLARAPEPGRAITGYYKRAMRLAALMDHDS